MVERYIGVENEFITFEKGKQISFTADMFEKLKDWNDVNKGITAIRKANGLGYYIDGDELELLTPPIALNQGFASRLTDCLMRGRDDLLTKLPKLKHTGYGMHWNLTNSGLMDLTTFIKDLNIPFTLFTQTPLSMGTGFRDKIGRYELLGDNINNYDQIKATALLLGAYSLAADFRHGRGIAGMPVSLGYDDIDNFEVKRDSKIMLYLESDDRYMNVPVQNYLTAFYNHLSPIVAELSTTEEKNNLEAFIFGDKQLEIEKKELYKKVKSRQGYNAGIFKPIGVRLDKKSKIQSMAVQQTIRPSYGYGAKEAHILGSIVQGRPGMISEMNWTELTLNSMPRGRYSLKDIDHVFDYGKLTIKGIGSIYKFGAQLTYTRFSESISLDDLGVEPKKIKYNPDKQLLEVDE